MKKDQDHLTNRYDGFLFLRFSITIYFMPTINPSHIEELKRIWTDRFVRVNLEVSELKRFEGMIGRVVTVNWSGKAIVDFADGAWYDIPASEVHLSFVSVEEATGKYDQSVNSAQPNPQRQG